MQVSDETFFLLLGVLESGEMTVKQVDSIYERNVCFPLFYGMNFFNSYISARTTMTNKCVLSLIHMNLTRNNRSADGAVIRGGF